MVSYMSEPQGQYPRFVSKRAVRFAGMAEQADARDLKSRDTRVSYRFDPGYRHQTKEERLQPLLFGFLMQINVEPLRPKGRMFAEKEQRIICYNGGKLRFAPGYRHQTTKVRQGVPSIKQILPTAKSSSQGRSVNARGRTQFAPTTKRTENSMFSVLFHTPCKVQCVTPFRCTIGR